MEVIKILLVEDHVMVRRGVKQMLINQHYFISNIDEAESGGEALKKTEQNNYDLIILDVSLPDISGVQVAQTLIKKNKSIKILALSMHQEKYVIEQMLNVGVKGYVLKNVGTEELTKAILTVYNNRRYYCNEVSQIIFDNKNDVNIHSRTLPRKVGDNLTKRELEVLSLIGQAFSDKEIADKLGISHRTANNHRNNLLQKLEAKNSAELVVYAIKNGFC